MSMGLNLKDEETVALVTEVAQRLGTTKTGAVRELARQKISELDSETDAQTRARIAENLRWLAEEVWPDTAGTRLSEEELDELLGYDEMYPR